MIGGHEMKSLQMGRSSRLWRAAIGGTAGLLMVAMMTSASGASGVAKLKGSYTVMVISNSLAGPDLPESFAQVAAGAEAGAKEVNASGGVNGRAIKIQHCETEGNSDTAVQCAEEAVKEKLSAVVGSFDLVGDYLSVLAKAHIPSIADWPVEQELSSQISYPIVSGGNAGAVGTITDLALKGLTSVALVVSDTAANSELPTIVAPVKKAFPKLTINIVTIPADDSDLSAVVATAETNQGIVVGAEPNDAVNFIRAIDSAGGTIPPMVISDLGAQSEIDQLGASANGLEAVDTGLASTDHGNHAVAVFDKYMNEVGPSIAKDAFAENAYLGVEIFAKAAQGLKSVTASNVIHSLNNLPTLSLGLIASFNFKHSQAAVSGEPRFFNPTMTFEKVENEKFISTTPDFYNIYTGKKVKP